MPQAAIGSAIARAANSRVKVLSIVMCRSS